MKVRVKNQLMGEIMVTAVKYPNGELIITVASQKTHPPVGALPIRIGELETVEIRKVGK